ncbi:hypothetical protein RKD49_000908 [Streptomyces glaucescens]
MSAATPVTVRPATEGDLPALLDLHGKLNPDDTPLPGTTADAVWAAIAGQRGRTVLVAEAGGAVAGTADCLVMPNLTRETGRGAGSGEDETTSPAYSRRGTRGAVGRTTTRVPGASQA